MSAGTELLSDVGRSGIQIFTGEVIHNWTLIADGNEEAVEVTVSGANMNDYALVSCSHDVADCVLDANVTAAGVVTVVAANNTGGNITIGGTADTTVKVMVLTAP